MSTEYEAVMLVGVNAKQAYKLADTEASFDNWVCAVQEETRWTWFEDEGVFGDVDLLPDSFTLDDMLNGVGDTLTLTILEEHQLLRHYFGNEVSISVTPCVYKY